MFTVIELLILGAILVQVLFAIFVAGAIGWAIFTYLHIGFFIAYVLVFVSFFAVKTLRYVNEITLCDYIYKLVFFN